MGGKVGKALTEAVYRGRGKAAAVLRKKKRGTVNFFSSGKANSAEGKGIIAQQRGGGSICLSGEKKRGGLS